MPGDVLYVSHNATTARIFESKETIVLKIMIHINTITKMRYNKCKTVATHHKPSWVASTSKLLMITSIKTGPLCIKAM